MANEIVKFKYGSKANIDTTTISAGTVYFATEIDGATTNGYIYFDKDNNTRILMGQIANKAQYDFSGHDIAGTYIASVTYDGTTNATSKVVTNFRNGKNQASSIDFPTASASSAGAITTGAQTIAGAKTFTGALTSSGGATFSNSSFNYSGIQNATANAARAVWFADSSLVGKPVYNNDFTYNPSTKTLVAENITGTASQAISDSNGVNIRNNYIVGVTASGSTLTITKGNNTTTTQTVTPHVIRRWS